MAPWSARNPHAGMRIRDEDAELEGLVRSHPSIEHSWCESAEGRIHVPSPWRLVDDRAWAREPDLRELELT